MIPDEPVHGFWIAYPNGGHSCAFLTRAEAQKNLLIYPREGEDVVQTHSPLVQISGQRVRFDVPGRGGKLLVGDRTVRDLVRRGNVLHGRVYYAGRWYPCLRPDVDAPMPWEALGAGEIAARPRGMRLRRLEGGG